MKICGKGHEYEPKLNNRGSNKGCPVCKSEWSKNFYENNKEKVLSDKKEYYINTIDNRKKYELMRHQRDSKSRNENRTARYHSEKLMNSEGTHQ